MGRYLFRLPDIGEGVAEAEIVALLVKIGDKVEEDQNVAEVMTDKATVELSSPVAGVVTAVHGDIGGMMPVGAVLIEFDSEAGEAEPIAVPAASPAAPVSAKASAPSAPEPTRTAPVAPPRPAASSGRPAGEAPLAAPSTRRRALDLGVTLAQVPGSGPGGRITPDDLDAFLASDGKSVGASGLVARTGVQDTRIIGLRRKIAEKMQEAKRRIPHINYVEECDLTELEALRLDLNEHRAEDQPKLTLLPFIMRAMVKALPDFPQVNALYDDDNGVLRAHQGVHIGIATQTPNGLIVPVVRHAEARDLWDCAREVARLAKAVRDGSASRDELSGSTITLTSMGPLGGIVSTPVINHPEVAILNPNKLVDRPMVQGSFVTIRKMMNLSSAFDHRIVDGYDAALFVQRVKRLLEHPALIFMD
ncbi:MULTISPECIES: dihydrolipoamide acetyltransferase family protein [unclassified Caulobacter]|jgi:2-oxoisovalerate dehydrogenase E2 component (dihydrolipoyl transacylase)|uniref:dihydrolipoamide acetyltransferase family protein n=1 Tax=unclassified Caulobacter TaxID=2648921 RepID=UPI000C151AEC|nr:MULTISPECIES: dihydrolipoamide acetyltransferase family protein [unclassified Caulobacter]AZS19263.1 2-oxo acid dehydrogenase subunit E2 [Caulobacter sp. FWC26]PIB90030.1 branched-chain alpha-keto acid dehydrogenase subunit E2 [Caulobacter sp. FWC2]